MTTSHDVTPPTSARPGPNAWESGSPGSAWLRDDPGRARHRVAISRCAVEPGSGRGVRGRTVTPAGRGVRAGATRAGRRHRVPVVQGGRLPLVTARHTEVQLRLALLEQDLRWLEGAPVLWRRRSPPSGDVSWPSWRNGPRPPPRSRRSAQHADAWPSGPGALPGLVPHRRRDPQRLCGTKELEAAGLAVGSARQVGVHPAALVVEQVGQRGRQRDLRRPARIGAQAGVCRRAEPDVDRALQVRVDHQLHGDPGQGDELVGQRLHGDRLAARTL